MSVVDELREWALVFLKSRDVFQKQIKDIEKLNGDFVLHKENEDVLFLVRPELESVEEIADKDGKLGLVVLNKLRNVKVVVDNWDALKTKRGLCIYFVNPGLGEKWMLFPFTHDQITERKALRKGLESLFSMVPPVDN